MNKKIQTEAVDHLFEAILTLENKEAVEALRKNYDSLTTTEKAYISKDSYDQLTALEAKIAELEKKAG